MDHSNLIGGVAARLAARAPVIWGVHHTNYIPQLTKRTTLMTVSACARLSRRLPTRIVCCSESARAAYARRGFAAERLTVIPNGFDTDAFRPDPAARLDVRRELGLAPDATLIGLVARYDPFKDHANFLRAAAALKGRLPDVHFLLCGDRVDPGNETLASMVAALGLRGRCHLLGQRRDMPHLRPVLTWPRRHPSARPSRWPSARPWPAASRAWRPTWATRPRSSARRAGWCPPRDPQALAAACQELLELSPEARARMGQSGRLRIQERYELASITRRYEDLYEALCAGGGRSTAPVLPGAARRRAMRRRGPDPVLVPPRRVPVGNRLSLVPGFTPDRPADGPGPEPTVLPWTDACPEVAAPGSGRAIKVLMIIEACGGGAGRHVLDLSEGLFERGCDVHLIYSPGRVDSFFRERLGRLRAIQQASYLMHRGIHPGDFSAVRWVRRYIRDTARSTSSMGTARKGGAGPARVLGPGDAGVLYTPPRVHRHGSGPGLATAAALPRGRMGLSKRPTGSSPSRPEEQRFCVRSGLGRSRVVLIPNGVAPCLPVPGPGPPGARASPADCVVAGFVGRLVDQKAPDVLIEALAGTAHSAAVPPDHRGDGAAGRGAPHPGGPLGRSPIASCGSGSATASAPARLRPAGPAEPQGGLALRGAGGPGRGAAGPGHGLGRGRILVRHGHNGLIVPPARPDLFAAALAELLSDPLKLEQFGRRSREISTEFTVRRMVDSTHDAYLNCIGMRVMEARPRLCEGVR